MYFDAEGALAKCQGFEIWTGLETYSWLDNALNVGFKVQPIRWVFAGSAASIVVLLSILRSKFWWFPLHPLGYCIGPLDDVVLVSDTDCMVYQTADSSIWRTPNLPESGAVLPGARAWGTMFSVPYGRLSGFSGIIPTLQIYH